MQTALSTCSFVLADCLACVSQNASGQAALGCRLDLQVGKRLSEKKQLIIEICWAATVADCFIVYLLGL